MLVYREYRVYEVVLSRTSNFLENKKKEGKELIFFSPFLLSISFISIQIKTLKRKTDMHLKFNFNKRVAA